MARRPLYVTPAGILGSLAVLVVVLVCVRLGLWQLDRLQERRTRNAAIAGRMALPPLTLDDAPADTAGLLHRRVALRGRYDHEHDIVLAGRSRRGLPGVHLYAPLRLDGGAVLVERGWLPSPDSRTADRTPFRRDAPVRIEGIALPFPAPEGSGFAEEGTGFPHTWFRLDGEEIADAFPYRLAPLYVRRLAGDTAEPAPTPLAAPELDDGPHLSYAVQWFSFAAIFLVGWTVLLVRSATAGERREPEGGTR